MSFFRPSNQTRRQRERNRGDWTLGAIFGSLDFATDGDPFRYLLWGWSWRFFAGALLAMAVIGAIYFGVTEIFFPSDLDPVMQTINGIESGSVTSSTLPDADVADVLAQFGG